MLVNEIAQRQQQDASVKIGNEPRSDLEAKVALECADQPGDHQIHEIAENDN